VPPLAVCAEPPEGELKSVSASPTLHPTGPASAAIARRDPASPAAALADPERADPGATLKKRLLITISSLLTAKPREHTLGMFLDGAPHRISIPQITMEPALRRKTSDSYGSHYQATSDFFAPRDLSELRGALAFARRAKRTLSFSGSGLSFDNQYMSDDLVVSLKNLRSIRVLPEERAVESSSRSSRATFSAELAP
jgi:hypothetical protein